MKTINFTERAVPGLTANFLMQEAISRYLFAISFLSKRSIVCDIACGTGYGTDILSKKAKQVYGVDISDEALNFASSSYKSKNISFLKMDATDTIFKNNMFDTVVAFEMIEHLKSQEMFLKEVRRILKTNGLFIVSTPNRLIQSPEGVVMSPYHTKEFSPQELEKLLNKQFRKVKLLGQVKSKRAVEAHTDFMNSQKARQLFVDIDIFGLRKLFPKELKEKFWAKVGGPFGRATQENLKTDDFSISTSNLDKCEYIIAVCRK